MEKKKVVIIDDEEDLCHLMKNFLVELDYDVFLANRLEAGLSLVHEVSPDVLFIDNHLPDGMGWEKMAYLKDAFPFCKINLISACKYMLPLIPDNPRITVIEKPLSLKELKEYL